MPPTPKIPKANTPKGTTPKGKVSKTPSKMQKVAKNVATSSKADTISKLTKKKFGTGNASTTSQIANKIATGSKTDIVKDLIENKLNTEKNIQRKEDSLTANQKNEYYQIKAQMRRRLAKDFGDNSVQTAESQLYAWSKEYWKDADPNKRDEAIMEALGVDTMDEVINIWEYADRENIKNKGVLLDDGEGTTTEDLTTEDGNTETEYEFSNAALQSQVERIEEFKKLSKEEKNQVIRQLYDSL